MTLTQPLTLILIPTLTSSFFDTQSVAGFAAFAGGYVFLGAGSSVVVGTVFLKESAITSSWGLGGDIAVLAGSLTLVGVPAIKTYALSASYDIGGRYFLGGDYGLVFVAVSIQIG